MTRTEIIQRFRDENPELTANVISNTTLNAWLLTGDKEICARVRLIVATSTITAVDGQAAYDLTALTDFSDINEGQGGGVAVVTSSTTRRIPRTTKAALDDESPSWRTASSGTPKTYYRYGKYMYMHPAPDTDTVTGFSVDYVKISDDFNNDSILPYNQLTYLEPFHPALVFYLTWRAKAKIGKPEEAAAAFTAYNAYITWMIKETSGGKAGPIEYRPFGQPSMGQYRS